ncbi:hypothetical protein R1sor_008816 [Riccia sorocarpa]|uniref:Uncharacterized protein n=1 Tax=Riccia sorocarpa TaxID=122646 RepID=A0ABD3HYI3_9MARC
MAEREEGKSSESHSKHEVTDVKDISDDMLGINDDFVKEMLNEGKETHLQTQSDATSVLNDDQPDMSTYDLSSGVDIDSDSVYNDTNSSKQWRGGVQGHNAPVTSTQFDNISSLKMTYYAFKDANVQKNGVPMSMLAAHIERKESRYPSFLGSRGSVSMGGGSSPGAWRTLQRSPSRKASSIDTYPSLAPQVLEVIRSLEEHQKKCENEGNYMAAQSAVQRLHGIKLLEDNKRKAAMIQRHLKERDEVEEAYKVEIDERNRLWDEKLHLFHKGVVEHAAKLKRQQIGILQAFRAKMAAKVPNKPQWSKELLKHRKVQVGYIMRAS